MYSLITFDMDGTLLDPSHKISQKTLDAIKRCAASGKTAALCTGRSVSELKEYLPGLCPYVRYAVCASGALGWDLLENKKIFSDSMTPETAIKAMDIAARFSPMTHFLSDYSIMQKSQWEHLENYNMGQYRKLYESEATMVEDITEMYKSSPFPLEKLNFYNRSPEARALLKDAIKKEGLPVEMRYAETASLELSPLGVTKGTGLLSLCRYLGISPAEAVSVGDSENDTDAFKVSGMGVAMGNAPEAVKAAAGLVVSDNAHDGCADAIEKLML